MMVKSRWNGLRTHLLLQGMLVCFADSVKDSLMLLRSFWAPVFTGRGLVDLFRSSAETEGKHKRGHLLFGHAM